MVNTKKFSASFSSFTSNSLDFKQCFLLETEFFKLFTNRKIQPVTRMTFNLLLKHSKLIRFSIFLSKWCNCRMCVTSGGSLPIRSSCSHFHFLSTEISANVLYFVSRRLGRFATTDLLSAPPLSTLVSEDQLDLELLDNGANFLWMLIFGFS